MLGVGYHQVLLAKRGGETILGEVPFSSLSYDKSVLDDIGQANVQVPPSEDDRVCELMSKLNSLEHEIIIYRDSDLAFVGPVQDPEWGDDGTRIGAKNLFIWFEWRKIYSDFNPITGDLVEIFIAYAEDALAPDSSPNIIMVQQNVSGISGERVALASEHRKAADELRELARSGVDFIMDGRNLLVAGQELDLPLLGILHDDGCVRRKIKQIGSLGGTSATVRGQSGGSGTGMTFGSNSNQIVGEASDVDGIDRYGLVEKIYSEMQIRDELSADFSATFRLDWINPPPEILEVTLAPHASFLFSDLLAGKKIDARIKAGCREFVGDRRVSKVVVNVEVSEEGESEFISLQLEPVGGES